MSETKRYVRFIDNYEDVYIKTPTKQKIEIGWEDDVLVDSIDEVVDLLNNQEERIQELEQENQQLKERNQRQYERLKEITDLMAERDWKSLEKMVEDWKQAEELLKREWGTYGDVE